MSKKAFSVTVELSEIPVLADSKQEAEAYVEKHIQDILRDAISNDMYIHSYEMRPVTHPQTKELVYPSSDDIFYNSTDDLTIKEYFDSIKNEQTSSTE